MLLLVDGRRKRQSTGDPVPVTADDVRYVSPSPLVDENDVLQVVFFVQSATDGVISGSDLAQTVQNNGAQLANTIGDSVCIYFFINDMCFPRGTFVSQTNNINHIKHAVTMVLITVRKYRSEYGSAGQFLFDNSSLHII